MHLKQILEALPPEQRAALLATAQQDLEDVRARAQQLADVHSYHLGHVAVLGATINQIGQEEMATASNVIDLADVAARKLAEMSEPAEETDGELTVRTRTQPGSRHADSSGFWRPDAVKWGVTNTLEGAPRDEQGRLILSARETRALWRKVARSDVAGACWEWIGCRSKHNYGLVNFRQRSHRPHRLVYEVLVGPIPAGMELHHLCVNPPCCNPAHMRVIHPDDHIHHRDQSRPSPNRLDEYRPVGERGFPATVRFWDYVDKESHPDGCWVWIGGRKKTGYGIFGIRSGQSVRAHRFSYEMKYGPVPNGLNLNHSCPGGGNPWCVNPDHLYLGTQRDNSHDKAVNGRTARGERIGIARFTEQDILEMRRERNAGNTTVLIAKRYATTESYVSKIVRGLRWGHLPLNP